MSDMPAVSAQTPLQPGAARGSDLVTPAAPISPRDPVMPGPNAITNRTITSSGGAGSPLVSDWQALSPQAGIHNGGQAQGQRSGAAWPSPKQDQGSSGDAPTGALDMDVRCIDIPAPPHASQSTGPGVGATEHFGAA